MSRNENFDHGSDHRFSPQLQAAIEQRAAMDADALKDPEFARNSCESCSAVFMGDLNRHGAHGGAIEVHREGMPTSHVVNVAEGHVIDWTARQFDRKAKVPHIEPIKSFVSRYDSVQGRGTAKRSGW